MLTTSFLTPVLLFSVSSPPLLLSDDDLKSSVFLKSIDFRREGDRSPIAAIGCCSLEGFVSCASSTRSIGGLLFFSSLNFLACAIVGAAFSGAGRRGGTYFEVAVFSNFTLEAALRCAFDTLPTGVRAPLLDGVRRWAEGGPPDRTGIAPLCRAIALWVASLKDRE
ncbi:hypothetical protein ABW21_db0204783 [Orbilia brochopaga]|nr:hypothetical protein ABW21_db0204783 [Drechslerella brochopaga]